MTKTHYSFPVAVLFATLLGVAACSAEDPECEGAECVTVPSSQPRAVGEDPPPTRADCEAACDVLEGSCQLTNDEDVSEHISCVTVCREGVFTPNELACLVDLPPCSGNVELCL